MSNNDLNASQPNASESHIFSLDLDPIKVKLMDPIEGEGWSRQQVDLVETWYQRFLLLNLRYPGEVIVPNKLVDKMWHAHLLHSRKYEQDCKAIFGQTLHHNPSLGMGGPEDAKNLRCAFDRTKALFELEFGEGLDRLVKFFTSSPSAAADCLPDCSKCCPDHDDHGRVPAIGGRLQPALA